MKSRGYEPASQAELGCPNLQDDATPSVRLESGKGNNHFQMNRSNSWMGWCQSPIAFREQDRAPRRGAQSPGWALRSVPATPTGPAPSPATCRDASISLKWEKRKRERTSEWHLPDDYIRKPSRFSRSCSSFPPWAQQQQEVKTTNRILKSLPGGKINLSAAVARAARAARRDWNDWREVERGKSQFCKREKKKRKNALWEKSPRARPLVNDLRVKPTAAATQQQQPHRSARPRAWTWTWAARGVGPPGRVAQGAGQAGGGSAGVSSGPSRGRRRQPAPSQRCCRRGPGHVGCFFFFSFRAVYLQRVGGWLEQPVRERPAVCLQIEVFSSVFTPTGLVCSTRKRRFPNLLPSPRLLPPPRPHLPETWLIELLGVPRRLLLRPSSAAAE